MKFYLSSYRLGNDPEKLSELFSNNKAIGYVPNALDFTLADPQRRRIHIKRDMVDLKRIGLSPILLDLRRYFGEQLALKNKIQKLGGIWVSGGNVFVLRQAMKLSGLDDILTSEEVLPGFVYAGYSAGGCVLSPRLEVYESYSVTPDDVTDLPYQEQKETIWEGLGLISYFFIPHYDSGHPKNEDIQKKVAYFKEQDILHKALRDGETVIITKESR